MTGRGPGAHLTRRLVVERRLRLTAVTGFELRIGADFLDRKDQILGLFRSRTNGSRGCSSSTSRPPDSPANAIALSFRSSRGGMSRIGAVSYDGDHASAYWCSPAVRLKASSPAVSATTRQPSLNCASPYAA